MTKGTRWSRPGFLRGMSRPFGFEMLLKLEIAVPRAVLAAV
jgi:hypothetical protein